MGGPQPPKPQQSGSSGGSSSGSSDGGSESEEAPMPPLQFFDVQIWESGTNRLLAEEISGRIKASRVTAFLGTNQLHKNSLLRALTGCSRTPITLTGRIIFDGQELRESIPLVQKRIVGYLPKNPPLPEFLTLQAAVTFAIQIQRPKWERRLKKKVKKIIEDCGLVGMENERLRDLTGADRVKAGIAYYCLCASSPVLVAEYPLHGLSRREAKEVLKTFQDISRARKLAVTLVLDTPFSAGLHSHVDYLVILAKIPEASQIVFDGKTAESIQAFMSRGFQLTPFENFSEEILDMASRTDGQAQQCLAMMAHTNGQRRTKPDLQQNFQFEKQTELTKKEEFKLLIGIGMQWLAQHRILLTHAAVYAGITVLLVSLFSIPTTLIGIGDLGTLVLVVLSACSLFGMQEYGILKPLFELADCDLFHGKYSAVVFAATVGAMQLITRFFYSFCVATPLYFGSTLGLHRTSVNAYLSCLVTFTTVGYWFDSVLFLMHCGGVSKTMTVVVMAQLIAVFALFSGTLLAAHHVPTELFWIYHFNPLKIGVHDIMSSSMYWGEFEDDSFSGNGAKISGSDLLSKLEIGAKPGDVTGSTLVILLSCALRVAGSYLQKRRNTPAQFKETSVDIDPRIDDEFMNYLSNESHNTYTDEEEDQEADVEQGGDPTGQGDDEADEDSGGDEEDDDDDQPQARAGPRMATPDEEDEEEELDEDEEEEEEDEVDLDDMDDDDLDNLEAELDAEDGDEDDPDDEDDPEKTDDEDSFGMHSGSLPSDPAMREFQ